MKLSSLIKGIELIDKTSQPLNANPEITAISCDSREITPNSLFLAVEGYAVDGHDYIGQAFDNGAAAVIAQKVPHTLSRPQKDKIILVRDSRKATAAIAATFYNHPSRDVVLVGITGTNGKTTITWIMESIFTACGFSTGVIGTVNIRYPGKSLDNPITTPDAITLQKNLREMQDSGVTHVLMEVSSHSLDQHRVDGCEFNAGVYTNLTQDHLDYHETMEDYFQCKQRLFTDFLGDKSHSKTAPAVINLDDDRGPALAESLSSPKILVSHSKSADIQALDMIDQISGLTGILSMNGQKLPMRSSLTGKFNLENILCAAGASLAVGIDPEKIIHGIEALKRVPGRMEKLDTPLNRHIFVDYAHTPDALASILQTLSQMAPARIITVFGCGGDRDKTKRSPMGQIACQYSDIAIVTSDNPRTESPEAITADIIIGIQARGIKELTPDSVNSATASKGYILEVDRAKALEMAVRISRPQDIIVAAGKGHETYQITNSGTIHFDDVQHLSLACEKLLTPMAWAIKDLSSALKTDPALPVEDKRFSTIGTDSRTITPDMVFLALKGESFDGHTFIPALVEKGINGFVVETGYLDTLDPALKDRMDDKSIALFETRDTLTALGMLARYQRQRSNVKLVAITGSNGKTTTRKMTREIFSTQFTVLATKGNFNNEVGMPLTLLNLSLAHEWAVIEMGMNHPGEISRLSAIACPDIAMITNTSGAHLEGLKTADNVAHAKAEIFQHVQKNGTAIIFADDPRCQILEDHARENPDIDQVCFFGDQSKTDTKASQITSTGTGTSFLVRENGSIARYTVNSPARFMVNNALAAITAAQTAGIDPGNIRTGLENFTPVQGRMNLGQLSNGINLIDDTYNANPASMAQALKTLIQVADKGQGIAILGDMLELGPTSAQLHRKMGFLAAKLNPARVYLFGKEVAHLMEGAIEKGYPRDRIFIGPKDEIAALAAKALKKQNWILLKGSRGMAMETLIPALEARIKLINKNLDIPAKKEY